MNYIKIPNENEVDLHIKNHEPLLVLISYDDGSMIISHLDEAVEHHILLAKAGLPETYIDRYFRVVLDENTADWTFVCPENYKNISDKNRRISEFYKDGFKIISEAISEIGYFCDLNIPKRYRRHFDML